MRRLARRRSLVALAGFTAAMLIAFLAPCLGFGLICGADSPLAAKCLTLGHDGSSGAAAGLPLPGEHHLLGGFAAQGAERLTSAYALFGNNGLCLKSRNLVCAAPKARNIVARGKR